MKLKVDENLPVEVAVMLLQAGHDAMTVYDQRMMGASDVDLLQVCQTEQRALVTADLDFSNVVRYPPERLAGLVVLRLGSQEIGHVLGAVHALLLPVLKERSPAGELWVVEDDRVRVRESP